MQPTLLSQPKLCIPIQCSGWGCPKSQFKKPPLNEGNIAVWWDPCCIESTPSSPLKVGAIKCEKKSRCMVRGRIYTMVRVGSTYGRCARSNEV
mmetsp:Transcript_2425/g.8694  ORF Transcript_2425/g.8694 Transcript_2425/m.8694 type:complete len:93 (+) Transcript_2425:398-676(+)